LIYIVLSISTSPTAGEIKIDAKINLITTNLTFTYKISLFLNISLYLALFFFCQISYNGAIGTLKYLS